MPSGRRPSPTHPGLGGRGLSASTRPVRTAAHLPARRHPQQKEPDEPRRPVPRPARGRPGRPGATSSTSWSSAAGWSGPVPPSTRPPAACRSGLVEARDFASGTSSRSSKLVHGGLRYLEMLDFALVAEALQERGLLLPSWRPHLVRPVPFLYPLHGRVLGARLRRRRRRALRHHGPALRQRPRRCPHHRHLTRRKALRIVPALKQGAR